MFRNFTTDIRLLGYDHRLESYRILVELQVADEGLEPVILQCDFAECGVQFVQCMTYLVDGSVFLPCKSPILVNSIFFQKISDFVT